MRRYEVTDRDGLARIGLYRTDEGDVITPSAVEVTELFPGLLESSHSNVPLGAPEGFVSAYEAEYEGVVCVHPASEKVGESGDCLMATNWHTVLDNPRHYVEWLLAMKDRHPPDALWYAPAAALPSNVATLISSGFDLFDFTAVDLKSAQGFFCTSDGEFKADQWQDKGICNCTGCTTGDLRLHNRLALQQEIAVVRHFISEGHLRELMEKRCRNGAPQVSILRLLDNESEKVEPQIPIARSVQMWANSGESIRRPEIRRFAERVIERFRPARSDVAVIIPCSAKKPYSLSQSHRRFQATIRNRGHELIITSPLGLVPRELERIYPAAHYDVPVTGYWDLEERAFISEILVRYFTKNSYKRVIAHIDGDALEIMKEAASRLGIEIECTCEDNRPTSTASLSRLDEALTGERRKQPDIIGGTLSWQFGTVPDIKGLMIRGRNPRERVTKGKTQFFSIDPGTGLFRPTMFGWELLGDCYQVKIDNFVPKGDVLAPGILDADLAIRPGDEVFVTGPSAVATGKAVMGASEMLSSKRGVAVIVRKVKKL